MLPGICRNALLKIGVRLAALGVLAFATITPANAAMTIFSASVFDQSGSVANAAFATGSSNGAGAIVGDGGVLTLLFNNPLTGAGVTVDLLATTGVNFITVSVGEIIGGVATFSAGSVALFDSGAGGSFPLDLTALCATVSATGCSLVRFQNFVAIGSPGFVLDGVSGVTNAPEPGVWALMIIGFSLLAWRLKYRSHRDAGSNAAISFSPA